MPATIPTKLPDDTETLKSLVNELSRDIHQYQMRIDYLTRRLFGRSSERIDASELSFFGLDESCGLQTDATEQPESESEEPNEEKSSSTRRKGRRKAPRDLPRQRVVHDLSPEEKICSCCGIEKQCIGEEVSEQYDYIPAQLLVLEHARLKYACKHCQGEVAIADKPAQPIEKGNAAPGLLAHVIVSKYCDHLPLHRQERIFARHNVCFSRQTLDNWTLQCADLLKPLWSAMCRTVVCSKILNTDDTPVPVQVKGQGKTHRSYLWVYIGDNDHPLTVYDFTWTRNRAGPKNFLSNFTGYLQADAFKGYDELFKKQSNIEVGCWAHARRYYFDARKSDPTRAHLALQWIQKLYKVEKEAKENNLDFDDRLLLRAERSRPILKAMHQWAEENQQQVLPKSPIGQAISYMLNQWEALERYLEDGRLSIDNNVAERALRTCVLGRKNWLFAGNERGGHAAAILYSLIESAKQNGHEPFAYLRDVLKRIPTHSINRIHELMPNYWQPNDV